jgi:hypothetical protein
MRAKQHPGAEATPSRDLSYSELCHSRSGLKAVEEDFSEEKQRKYYSFPCQGISEEIVRT